MKASMSATFFLLSIILFPPVLCVPQLIDNTCKKTPFYDLCVSSLRSNPRSAAAADVESLALIMVDNVEARATELVRHIKSLIRAGQYSNARKALQFCAEAYGAVINADVVEAREALTKGDYKFAEAGTNDAANEVASCERRLGGKVPQLSGMNKGLHDVSVIASFMVRILLES